jgi:hypothetical protein
MVNFQYGRNIGGRPGEEAFFGYIKFAPVNLPLYCIYA